MPDLPVCPVCAQAMQHVSAPAPHYACAGCGGRLLGLAPFERLLADGVGAHLWVASADGDEAAKCPVCQHPMRTVPPSAGNPVGLSMCRICQQVWVPGAAADWIAGNTSSAGVPPDSALAHPARCGDCGAPWEPDDSGCCKFCRARLTTPSPTVAVFEAGVPQRSGSRLIDAISDLLQ